MRADGTVSLFLNDRDIADIAVDLLARVYLADATGVTGMADVLSTEQAPGNYGVIVSSEFPSAAPVDYVAKLGAIGASFDDMSTIGERIRAWCGQSSVIIRNEFNPGRETVGRLTAITTAYDKSAINGFTINATFMLDVPLWWERWPRTFGLVVGDRLAVPMGSGPAQWYGRLRGPAVNPLIRYRSLRGDVLATLAFAATLGAKDYVDINPADRSVIIVTDGVAGTAAAGIATIVAGSRFPTLSPVDGDLATGTWGTLEVADDNSTVTGRVVARRSYR